MKAKYEVRIDHMTTVGMRTDTLSRHLSLSAAFKRLDRELRLLNRPYYAAPQSLPRLWVAEVLPGGGAWVIKRDIVGKP